MNGAVYMNIEFCMFDYPVMFPEVLQAFLQGGLESADNKSDPSVAEPVGKEGTIQFTQLEPVTFSDVESTQNNLVEEKYIKISMEESSVDRERKPNSHQSKLIQTILDYGPLQKIQLEEKKLLWRYRYYIRGNKKALTKFLISIDWSFQKESKEALVLLEEWEEIDTVDALFLLSRLFDNIEAVRQYAIKIISKADDDVCTFTLLTVFRFLRILFCNWCKHCDTKRIHWIARSVNS